MNKAIRLSGTTFGTLPTKVHDIFLITTTGAATATLPNGQYEGEKIYIQLVADGGDLVVSGDFSAGLVSATFAAAGDSLYLMWVSSSTVPGGWQVLGTSGTPVLA
jgi:hypothetical protein